MPDEKQGVGRQTERETQQGEGIQTNKRVKEPMAYKMAQGRDQDVKVKTAQPQVQGGDQETERQGEQT